MHSIARSLVIYTPDNKILLFFQSHVLYLIIIIIMYATSKLYTDIHAKTKPTNWSLFILYSDFIKASLSNSETRGSAYLALRFLKGTCLQFKKRSRAEEKLRGWRHSLLFPPLQPDPSSESSTLQPCDACILKVMFLSII